MSTTTPLTTAENLIRMPDDGYRYERVSGELRQRNPAGSLHGVVVGNLTVVLGQHVRAHRLGAILGAETDISLLTENDTLDGGEVVPGFRCPVAEIFSIE